MKLTPYLYFKLPFRVCEVPPQERLPLKLKDKVTTSNQRNEMACLNELHSLISCLNEHDYSNTFCTEELLGLQNCHKSVVARQKEKKILQKKGELTHTMKNYTAKQITNLLKKYPTM